MKNLNKAFTLTEILIAVAIVGIIAGMVLPKIIENYQLRAMNSSYQREVQTIESSINGLAVSENKADFFSTMMYSDIEPENYDETACLYMKKYLRTSKMCDNPEDCFADTYYQYEAGKKREEYKPDYKGACAILKNGVSICMTPQIGADNIKGIMDLNGKRGPNVLDRDLRTFAIAAKTRVGLNQDTEGVKVTEWNNISGNNTPPDSGSDDACDTDPNSLGCCQTKSISDPSDPCCTYEEIKKNNPNCKCQLKLQCTPNAVLWGRGYAYRILEYGPKCSLTSTCNSLYSKTADITFTASCVHPDTSNCVFNFGGVQIFPALLADTDLYNQRHWPTIENYAPFGGNCHPADNVHELLSAQECIVTFKIKNCRLNTGCTSCNKYFQGSACNNASMDF